MGDFLPDDVFFAYFGLFFIFGKPNELPHRRKYALGISISNEFQNKCFGIIYLVFSRDFTNFIPQKEVFKPNFASSFCHHFGVFYQFIIQNCEYFTLKIQICVQNDLLCTKFCFYSKLTYLCSRK